MDRYPYMQREENNRPCTNCITLPEAHDSDPGRYMPREENNRPCINGVNCPGTYVPGPGRFLHPNQPPNGGLNGSCELMGDCDAKHEANDFLRRHGIEQYKGKRGGCDNNFLLVFLAILVLFGVLAFSIHKA